MRVIGVFIIVTGFCLGNTAMGFSWSANYYDHGASPFDHNNNTAPIEYPFGIGYFFVAYDQDYLYLALTNSFGLEAASNEWETTFAQGDIFFGYGGEQNTYAIDVASGDFMSVDLYDYIEDKDGSYYSIPEIRTRIGAYNVVWGTSLGTANQKLSMFSGLEYNPLYAPEGPLTPDETGGDTYVFEWKIDRGLLGWDGTTDIFFHTTLGCGNDLIEYHYYPIPEPSTMILLGLGLCGMGMFTKRR
jgi:hypothetical protein